MHPQSVRRYGILLPFLSSLLFTSSVAFDTKKQWAWVDKSCDDKIDRLDKAGDDFLELTKAAHEALGSEGDMETRNKDLLQSYMGIKEGVFIKKKYEKLKDLAADGEQFPYSLYCDGSAFEWTTEYVDADRKGEEIPGGGMWYAKRQPEDAKQLYIEGKQRDHYCPDNVYGASVPGGSHIILCPKAFEALETLEKEKDKQQEAGTSLDKIVSTGSVMLHEVTHAALTTRDHEYGSLKCILLAGRDAPKARGNADSYEYLSLGIYLAKTQWRLGIAVASS